jgi:hypothetical protein
MVFDASEINIFGKVVTVLRRLYAVAAPSIQLRRL